MFDNNLCPAYFVLKMNPLHTELLPLDKCFLVPKNPMSFSPCPIDIYKQKKKKKKEKHDLTLSLVEHDSKHPISESSFKTIANRLRYPSASKLPFSLFSSLLLSCLWTAREMASITYKPAKR